MNKRGQYFLIAAILIIIVLVGFASINTYAITRPESKVIPAFSSELTEESSRIVEHGIYNEKDVNDLIGNFTAEDYAEYFLKKTDNANIIFLYGDVNEVKALRYKEDSPTTIIATIGGNHIEWETVNAYSEQVDVFSTGDGFFINLLGNRYDFKLGEGKVFYFIIVQETEDEVIVLSSGESEISNDGGDS